MSVSKIRVAAIPAKREASPPLAHDAESKPRKRHLTDRAGRLVLSRRKGEAIIVGDGIRVTVVEIRGDKVRISIKAPKDVAVHREEIWRRIQDVKAEEVTLEAEREIARLSEAT